jgi:hypothetical protein
MRLPSPAHEALSPPNWPGTGGRPVRNHPCQFIS